MAVYVPENGRIWWAIAHADIPANWSRDTDFDGKYLQGLSSGGTAGTNGGGATHTHISVNHNHTGASHNHLLSITGVSSGTTQSSVNGNSTISAAHTHSGTKPTFSTSAEYNNTAITVSSDAIHPPNLRMIVIKPDDATQQVPDNGIIAYAAAGPAGGGFSTADGTGGTPDVDDLFTLTPGTGADGDWTPAGALTHTHTLTNHTHTAVGHSHANSDFPKGGSAVTRRATGMGYFKLEEFHHSATSIGTDSTITSSQATTATMGSSEPEFIQMLGIQNTNGSAVDVPVAGVLPWVGTEGSIPSGWQLADGTGITSDMQGKQIKFTTDNGDVADTGGSATHTHLASSHNHTVASHTHTYSFSIVSSVSMQFGLSTNVASVNHTHTSNAMATENFSTTSTGATMSSDDTRFSYRTVFWIEFTGKSKQPAVFFSGNF